MYCDRSLIWLHFFDQPTNINYFKYKNQIDGEGTHIFNFDKIK